jgi:hypothetical protein
MSILERREYCAISSAFSENVAHRRSRIAESIPIYHDWNSPISFLQHTTLGTATGTRIDSQVPTDVACVSKQ